MGEAKQKMERRKAHAGKIVAGLERFMESIYMDKKFGDISYRVDKNNCRDELIELLTTPPPKD